MIGKCKGYFATIIHDEGRTSSWIMAFLYLIVLMIVVESYRQFDISGNKLLKGACISLCGGISLLTLKTIVKGFICNSNAYKIFWALFAAVIFSFVLYVSISIQLSNDVIGCLIGVVVGAFIWFVDAVEYYLIRFVMEGEIIIVLRKIIKIVKLFICPRMCFSYIMASLSILFIGFSSEFSSASMSTHLELLKTMATLSIALTSVFVACIALYKEEIKKNGRDKIHLRRLSVALAYYIMIVFVTFVYSNYLPSSEVAGMSTKILILFVIFFGMVTIMEFLITFWVVIENILENKDG